MFKRVFKENWLVITVLGIILAVVIINIIIANTPKEMTTAPTVTPNSSWAMQAGDYRNNRWFSDGINQIRTAKNDQQASDALAIWLDRVKRDPNLLVGAAKFFLDRDVKKESLVKDGWATDSAVQLVTEIELQTSKSNVLVQDAPANGYNTGVENSTVVASSNEGVSGNRKAIKVETPDKKTIFVMARCGNIVAPDKPRVSTGKTDNPPIDPMVRPIPTVEPGVNPGCSNTNAKRGDLGNPFK